VPAMSAAASVVLPTFLELPPTTMTLKGGSFRQRAG
jgi:hypothetical protein